MRFSVHEFVPHDGPHTTFAVFVDGASCGELTMRRDEAEAFKKMLEAHNTSTTVC